MKNGKRTWDRIRRVWATLGILALLGFAGWSFVAYRASSDAQMTFISDARVSVTRGEDCWLLAPAATSSLNVGLVFFPGALVEPAAYGPLLRKVALSGYPVLLIELPRRGAFGGADGGEVIGRAQRAMQAVTSVSAWVVAGHSRGGVAAARFVREGRSEGIRGLVLVGTSHPRDFSLAEVTLPVTKIPDQGGPSRGLFHAVGRSSHELSQAHAQRKTRTPGSARAALWRYCVPGDRGPEGVRREAGRYPRCVHRFVERYADNRSNVDWVTKRTPPG